jgi:hypothetical protein
LPLRLKPSARRPEWQGGATSRGRVALAQPEKGSRHPEQSPTTAKQLDRVGLARHLLGLGVGIDRTDKGLQLAANTIDLNSIAKSGGGWCSVRIESELWKGCSSWTLFQLAQWRRVDSMSVNLSKSARPA